MTINDYSGETLSRANPMVKRILAVAFPEYTGRKIKARTWTKARQLENYWSGGSRSYYVAIRVSDGAIADFGTDNPFVRSTHEPVDLPAGILLVENTIFCGKNTGITIWARAEALEQGIAPAMLEAGA